MDPPAEQILNVRKFSSIPLRLGAVLTSAKDV